MPSSDDATIPAPSGHGLADGAPSSSALRAAPAIGTRLGRYVVEAVIGSGGMGVVVAARHEHLGERVAIKLLRARATDDKVVTERFVREARSTARIRSEHVVRVLDVGEQDNGAPYLVMEMLEGCDLSTLLTRNGPLPWAQAVDYVLQACEAIANAHAAGIVHRDLKPSNLFLTKRVDGSDLVKVLDFGISKAMVDDPSTNPRLTDTQAVFGSPTYMSPEQIRSAKNVDARTDVWALGVVLFELVTGKLPFFADNVAGLLASVIADAPFRPTSFAPMPPEVEATILACLEKDPDKRIPSVGDLASRLAPFASPETRVIAGRAMRISTARSSRVSWIPPAAPSTPPLAIGTTGVSLNETVAELRGQARHWSLVAGAFAIVLVVGGALFSWSSWSKPRASTPPPREDLASGAMAPPMSAPLPSEAVTPAAPPTTTQASASPERPKPARAITARPKASATTTPPAQPAASAPPRLVDPFEGRQ